MSANEDEDNVELAEFYIVDRAFDDRPFPVRLLPFSPSESTKQLVDSWLRLQNSRTESDLQSPEWKSLEAAYLKHLEWRFDYPKKVLQQQLVFAWFMTAIIVILVAVGLVFAFLQLSTALSIASFSNLDTEIAIQTAGTLSFRSSLVGASVLMVSLGFFYLYLRYVFASKSPMPPHIPLAKTDAPALFGKKSTTPKRKRARRNLNEEKQSKVSKNGVLY